ncbi:DUF4169 family protein [Ascidiaceihabitans sp.]|uniref:DUF4169 family protein n=1 Tax=Ascidiaceihabitans sp. TaxID=1872644 RepID=UPI00329815DF
MSAPVNLNRVRKQKARAAKSVRANENAALHGRTKAEKATQVAADQKALRHLDNHKRDT